MSLRGSFIPTAQGYLIMPYKILQTQL